MNSIAFVIPKEYRYVAAVLLFALLAWTMGLPAWLNTAEAATVSTYSDTLSDSDLGVGAAHRIEFATPNGIADNGTMVFTFDPDDSFFDFTGFTLGDVDVVSGATQVANVGACGAPADEMYATLGGGDTVVLNLCAGHTIASSTSFVIDVGTTTGGNLIGNPATTSSYVIELTGTGNFVDSGDTRVAIIDDVTVTAAVDTVFTFSINGIDPGITVNDDPVQTTGTSTATTVPFGTITPGGGNAKLMAQELRVDTNAFNGFAVTVRAETTLTAGNGATIDEFIDGAATASTTQWTSPAGTLGVTDTYGHWGITTDDNVVSGASSTQWGIGEAVYRGDFIGNDVEIFYHNTPVEYAQGGQGVGSTTVAYKVEITNLQEAAKDYTAELTYIATPVF